MALVVLSSVTTSLRNAFCPALFTILVVLADRAETDGEREREIDMD
jgi:hypothetical protein